MKVLIRTGLVSYFIWTPMFAQNPPNSGDPYKPRGESKSPDGTYTWTVRTDAPIRYELVELASRRPVVTVDSYFPEADPENILYANAVGIYWNSTGNRIVLDELNRRRSGKIYFFSITNGKPRQLQVIQLIPIPPSADEARLVVDPGWISPTKIRTRLAMKDKNGEFESIFYLIDLANPDKPSVEPTK
jgi:hypothetical protein